MTADQAEVMRISLRLEESDVWRCLGAQDRVVPGLSDEVAEATALGLELSEPLALFRTLAIEQVAPREVTFEDGRTGIINADLKIWEAPLSDTRAAQPEAAE